MSTQPSPAAIEAARRFMNGLAGYIADPMRTEYADELTTLIQQAIDKAQEWQPIEDVSAVGKKRHLFYLPDGTYVVSYRHPNTNKVFHPVKKCYVRALKGKALQPPQIDNGGE